MSNLTKQADELLARLRKVAATPVQDLQAAASSLPGQASPPGMPMDPAAAAGGAMPPGAPMDPAAMGMPMDPAAMGMPTDPAAMGMDPAAMGMPMDPAAMGMPVEDPLEKVNKGIEELLKLMGQVRTIVASLADASGIQIPLDKALAAGDDAVKNYNEAVAKPAEEGGSKKAAGYDEISDGVNSNIETTLVLEEDVVTRQEQVEDVDRKVSSMAANLLRSWGR